LIDGGARLDVPGRCGVRDGANGVSSAVFKRPGTRLAPEARDEDSSRSTLSASAIALEQLDSAPEPHPPRFVRTDPRSASAFILSTSHRSESTDALLSQPGVLDSNYQPVELGLAPSERIEIFGCDFLATVISVPSRAPSGHTNGPNAHLNLAGTDRGSAAAPVGLIDSERRTTWNLE
jgi:hypothetical protein